jgi:hypothetical protein
MDLGLGAPDGQQRLEAALPLVGHEVSREEAVAARALAARLGSGGDPFAADPLTPEGALRDHLLAGLLDARYRRALKLRALAQGPGAGLPRLARELLRALVLSREQVDAIYGPPRTRLGYLARRLARPLDLAWRGLLALLAAAALRVRRSRHPAASSATMS